VFRSRTILAEVLTLGAILSALLVGTVATTVATSAAAGDATVTVTADSMVWD